MEAGRPLKKSTTSLNLSFIHCFAVVAAVFIPAKTPVTALVNFCGSPATHVTAPVKISTTLSLAFCTLSRILSRNALNLAGGTQDLRIGADSTGAKRLTGNVEYFAMGKTLGAKTQTVRFSARGRSSATTSWTSAKGETWTLNGAATLTGSSPYYGSLLPNRQIRAYVVTNEATPATRHLFRGYVDAWPQFYSRGNADATVVVEASDMFKIFSRIDKKSYYLTYIEETLNPEYWFKFDESPGAERCRNRGSGAQYNLHGTYHNMSAKDFERAAVVPYPDPDSCSVRFR